MKDIDKELDTILTNYYRKTIRVDGNTPNSRQEAKQAIKQLINQARIEELQWVHPMPLELRSTIAIEKRIAELKRE